MNKTELKTLNNKIDFLTKMAQIPMGETFVASDYGISGATMKAHADLHIYEVVGTEDVWYQVDTDTMKRSERKIYRKTSVVNSYALNWDIKKVKREIENRMTTIAKLTEEIGDLTQLLNSLENIEF